MNEVNLKLAFDFFDENHDGHISVTELQRIFCGIQSDMVIENIIEEIDIDKDCQVFICINIIDFIRRVHRNDGKIRRQIKLIRAL